VVRAHFQGGIHGRFQFILFKELKTMLQINPFHQLKISALGSVSAPTCLGLAERTFGKKSPEYRSVLNFTKEKRAASVARWTAAAFGFQWPASRCLACLLPLRNLSVDTSEHRERVIGNERQLNRLDGRSSNTANPPDTFSKEPRTW
jgi:hypothetical protein